MFTVEETEEFSEWLAGLKDRPTRIRLGRRIDKVRRGILGDAEPVGEGVSELCEHFGPGWRMYYMERNGAIIVLLGGGNKSTQQRDIERAKKMAQELRNAQDQDPAI
jgi:putative addiction module killer protein